MRLLLIGYMFGKGGIQTHTHQLALGLTSKGHEVTVLSPPRMVRAVGELPTNRNYGLEVYGGVIDALLGWPKTMQKVDVIVVCGTGWKSMIGSLCYKRRPKRIFFEVMSGNRTGWFEPRDLTKLGFDAVIGQACPVKTSFKVNFKWKGKIATIPALSDSPEMICDIPPRRSENIERKQGWRFVYFGRLVASKGVQFLIDNWNELASSGDSLDIYGAGSDESLLRQKIEGLDLKDSIKLKGPYPSGRCFVELCSKYDLKLLATVGEEGAPLVLLEAMSCGLPFVANGVGGISDYENVDCQITSGDISEFIPAVRVQITRMSSGLVNSKRLRRFYKENFSSAILIDRWEKYLLSIIDEE